jgi:hypothetical protein
VNSFVRSLIVGVLVVYALALVTAASSVLWQPRGTFGFVSDYGARVRSVVPSGPAALAGIRAGDRIDLQSIAFDQRREVVGIGGPPDVGERVRLRILHAGVPNDVTLVAVPTEFGEGDRATVLLECGVSLVFIVVGAGLILLRPSWATWGFGLYCLTDLPAETIGFRFPSNTETIVALFVYDLIENLGGVGLLVFALEFPARIDIAWRRRLRQYLPAIFVGLSLLTMYPDVSTLLLGAGAGAENRALQVIFGAFDLLTIATLYDTYRRIAPDGRERMRWVLFGFSAGLITNYIGNTLIYSSLLGAEPPAWIPNLLVSLNVLLPLAIAHAVVRHRVLDVNLIISRALVYGGFTTVLAALFGLLDWFFGTVLDEFRLSRVIEASIAVAIAFAFNRVHHRIERFIEAVFFRKRRAAEERLLRLTRELPHARSRHIIETALVDEAVDTFGLTSAALFFLDDDGAFARTASTGWIDDECALLDDDDRLVLALRAESSPIKLADLPWRRVDIPGGGSAPVLAVPVASRTDLIGMVLYGAHTGGGDIDAEEAGLLERLVRYAGFALDALEAERLRREHEEQRAEVAALNARLDELHHLVAMQTPSADPSTAS